MSNARTSEYEKLGKTLLEGKSLAEIYLRGKKYKFDYTKEEFIETTLAKGWEKEFSEKCAEEYEKAKIEDKSIQSRFISDFSSDFCLNSGGFGCLEGKTKIQTSNGEISIEDLYNKRIAPFVYSYVNGKVKKARATVPIKYEKAQLFKVKLNNNKIIVATAKHRFLTQGGWKMLSDLSVGEELLGYVPFPQESISDSVQSVLLSNVFHLFRRVLGFLNDYHSFWNFFSRCIKVLINRNNLFSSYPSTINKNIVQSITTYGVDNYYDLHVFGTNNYLAEGVFHHNSGKSLALYIKMILVCKCFPGNRVLLGRKTLQDIDRAVLPELFELMPPLWYEYRVKDQLINFTNGSQIILFGLDAMQSGSIADIKKAQQKLKSLNLGAYFIDQLEEVEYEVFEVLNSRLRKTEVPFRQGNATCNPANYWAYHQFKLKEMWNGESWVPNSNSRSTLFESSMLHNPNLPGDYIRKQMAMGETYLRRFVQGIWDTSIIIKGSVFANEHLSFLERMRKAPILEEGCQIWEQPKTGYEYRMGVDPSEGVVDPSSISVVDLYGHKVAKFNGMITIQGLADKIKFLYYKYRKPLIIPESNNAGTALIREIRDLRIYKRKRLDEKWDKETEKLGFRTSWETKQQLISHFQNLLRSKAVRIYDKQTIDEMRTFQWNDDATHKGAGAARGFHDDDVISTMLAFWDWTPRKTDEILFAETLPVVKKIFQYR